MPLFRPTAPRGGPVHADCEAEDLFDDRIDDLDSVGLTPVIAWAVLLLSGAGMAALVSAFVSITG